MGATLPGPLRDLGAQVFRGRSAWLVLVSAFAAICWFNGNLWALAAIPVALGMSRVAWPVPRGRWALYGY